jgi:hypothetical protein
MGQPISLRPIHAVTAGVFLLAMVTLAIASHRLVGGSIGYSWLGFGASVVPLLWSVGLLLARQPARSTGWCSLVLSLVVVALGSSTSWPAISSLL